MAKSKSAFVPSVQFINYDLPGDEKEALKKWRASKSFDLADMIERAVDSGYVVSVKKDDYNQCLAAFLTPVGDDHPEHGFILTGRGSTAIGALTGLFYRHYVVFEGGWPKQQGKRVNLDDE